MNNRYEAKYIQRLLDHEEWVRKADQLLESAALFQLKIKETWEKWREGKAQSDHFIAGYFMFSSFALENLFKAIIILRDRKIIEKSLNNRCGLPKKIGKHNLYDLAKECGFRHLDAGDEELLKKLSRSATWYGRYPVPIMPDKFKTDFISELDKEPISTSSYSSDDEDDIQRWILRARERLAELAQYEHTTNSSC